MIRGSRESRESLVSKAQKVPKVFQARRVLRGLMVPKVLRGTQAIPHTRLPSPRASWVLKRSGSNLSWETKVRRGHEANRAFAGLRASRVMMEIRVPPESRVSVARRVIRAILARREIQEQRAIKALAAMLV